MLWSCNSLMFLEERVGRIEKDIAYLRGVVEQMDKRLGRIENEMARIRNEMLHLRDELNGFRDEVNRRMDLMFKWLVGLLFGMWTSIMCTLIPILLKLLGVL